VKEQGREWSDVELEAYLDDELDAGTFRQMSAALRTDPSLRARLAAIRRTDDLTRAALECPGRTTRWRLGRPRPVAWPAAAVLLIAVGLYLDLRHTDRGRPQSSPMATAAAVGDYAAIRVVLSVPLDDRAQERRRHLTARLSFRDAAEKAARQAAFIQADRWLARGNIEQTVRTLRRLPPPQRQVVLERLARHLGSTYTARRLLDRLAPTDQLTVCRRAVLDGRLNALMLERLHQLRGNPQMRPEVQRVVNELAVRPSLRPWLRSHDLLRG